MTESDVPDTSNAAEDTCSTITYTTNTTAWIVDLPATVQVVDLPCGTVATQSSQLVSDTQYTYDSGGTPTAGNLTKTQAATAASVQNLFGSYVWSYTYTTEQTSTFDQYGRVLTAKDADNRTTTTAYTPATGAEPTSVAVTDPASLATTTTYDPARTCRWRHRPGRVPVPPISRRPRPGDRPVDAGQPHLRSRGEQVLTTRYSATAPSVDTRQAEQPGGGLPDQRDAVRFPGPGSARPSSRPPTAARTSPTPAITPTAGRPSSPTRTTPAGRLRELSSPPRRAACRHRPATCTTGTAGSSSRSRTRSARRPGRPTRPTAGTTSPSSRRRAARRRRRSATAEA